MNRSIRNRAGVSLTAVALLALATGCQDGDGEKKTDGAGQSAQSPAKVLAAAFKKTSEAKTAKVRMTMTMPPGSEGAGTTEASGVMGWDPMVTDLTVSGDSLKSVAAEGGPDKMRMIMTGGAMYIDLGPEGAKEMDGKRWMSFDFAGLAKKSGDDKLQKMMTGSLESMNQDPAEQIALLLESKNLKHIGPAKVDGTDTQHYKGTLAVDEIMGANSALDILPPEDRETLLENIKKTGIKGYDTELWVNADGFPVKVVSDVKTPEGAIKTVANYSDYGTAVKVSAPPADQVLDFMKMMEELQKAGQDAGSGVA
jgi:hypothetical protein